jgi:hypothetical protein
MVAIATESFHARRATARDQRRTSRTSESESRTRREACVERGLRDAGLGDDGVDADRPDAVRVEQR